MTGTIEHSTPKHNKIEKTNQMNCLSYEVGLKFTSTRQGPQSEFTLHANNTIKDYKH